MKSLKILILLLVMPTAYAAGLETKEEKSKEAVSKEQQETANHALDNALQALFQVIVVALDPVSHRDLVDHAAVDPLLLNIKTALQQGGDILKLDSVDPAGSRDTLLHTIFDIANSAMPQRMQLVVELLLDQHVIHARELNMPNQKGMTPFELSLYTMPLPIIKTFIALGADVNVIDKEGFTPLAVAIERKRDRKAIREDVINELVQVLLAAGANSNGGNKIKCPTCPLEHYQHNPLFAAVDEPYIKVVHTLLKAGAEIEARVLPLAADINNMELVKLLLSYKSPVNGLDKDGHSALTWAVIKQNFFMAELLLNAGADIDIPDEDGFTPLMIVVMKGNLSMVSRLVGRGADVNKTDPKGKTALMYAAAKGHRLMVNFLLEHGADPLAIDKDAYDAYWYARHKAPAGKEAEAIAALLQTYKEQLRKNMTQVPHELFQIPDLADIIGEYATEPIEENEYETKAMLHGESSDEE